MWRATRPHEPNEYETSIWISVMEKLNSNMSRMIEEYVHKAGQSARAKVVNNQLNNLAH